MKLVRSGRLLVGDEKNFHIVKKLMPYHYRDIRPLTATRNWPNRKLEKMDIDPAV